MQRNMAITNAAIPASTATYRSGDTPSTACTVSAATARLRYAAGTAKTSSQTVRILLPSVRFPRLIRNIPPSSIPRCTHKNNKNINIFSSSN